MYVSIVLNSWICVLNELNYSPSNTVCLFYDDRKFALRIPSCCADGFAEA